ncbi:hypothetical protein JHK86_024377 [Glycine max]|nr:hypothetical protein JHK86_024377 [Glycine max]
MDSDGGSKLNGIRQIVKLKEMLQKWQSVTLGTKPSNSLSDHVTNDDGSISPLINKSVLNVMNCESDNEDSCQSPAEPLPPPDVPKGYLAVYVGPELRRFIIPTSYLSHPLFKVLLEKAADEFGFDQSGGLTIPCEIETFKYLLKCMENEQKEQLGDSARKLFALILSWFSSLPYFTNLQIYGETAAGSSGSVEEIVPRVVVAVSSNLDDDRNDKKRESFQRKESG